MRILLKIAYLGTAYHGWQVQPNGVTVQQRMQDAIESVYKDRLALTGCSRTDAGVHANEFYCHYDTEKIIPENGIVSALNSALPQDIVVLEASYVDEDFHARYSAKGKNYVYKILNTKTSSPFESDRCWHISRKLDLERINEFLSALVGKNDFEAFSSSGRTVTDTVRTITQCSAQRMGDYIIISVSADGFLYNMVRITVGTAVDVSDGKIEPCQARSIIDSRDRSLAGITAPPQGLYLNKVFY